LHRYCQSPMTTQIGHQSGPQPIESITAGEKTDAPKLQLFSCLIIQARPGPGYTLGTVELTVFPA
jgi:hypothetical protein